MIKFALDQDGPMAIRYPRGTAYDGLEDHRERIEMGKAEAIAEGTDVALLAVGSMVEVGEKVMTILADRGISCSLINMRFVKPIDEEAVLKEAGNKKLIVTMEENVFSGGFGEKVLKLLNDNKRDSKVVNIHIPDKYVEHGNPDILKKEIGIDADSVADRISGILKDER